MAIRLEVPGGGYSTDAWIGLFGQDFGWVVVELGCGRDSPSCRSDYMRVFDLCVFGSVDRMAASVADRDGERGNSWLS